MENPTTYMQYEWNNNTLLRAKSINNPLWRMDPTKKQFNSDLAKCNHVTVRRTSQAQGTWETTTIVSVYR